MMNDRTPANIIIGMILLITVITGIFSYIAPPAIFPDPSWGFQVMHSMEKGGGFNLLIGPDQLDIAKDSAQFLTWWSPGQYLMPYFFRSILHVNTGHAAVLTSVICELIGVIGFFALFKRLGFTPLLSAASVAFIACQQFYFIPYAFYNGGEVLMFAFVGWFLYGCFSFKRISAGMMLFVLLAGWAGFFSKSSMMLIYAAGLLCLWINISLPRKDIAAWIKNGVAIGIPFLLSVAGIYLFYLSKGDNPAADHQLGWRVIWETFTFPLASPLLAGFSIDDLTKGLVYSPDGAIFSHTGVVLILIALAALSLSLIWAILRFVPYQPYKLALIVYYLIMVGFFSYAFFKQLAISYEARHFRTIGLLIIPGTLYLVAKSKPAFRVAFGLIWIFIAYKSIERIHNEYNYNKNEGVHGRTGITQQFADQPTLDTIMHMDDTERDAIFVFVSADLGLEIQHNRFITIEPIGLDVKMDPADYVYQGHAGPLHILLPADYTTNGRANFIMNSFKGYKDFTPRKLSGEYTLWTAK
ncbi:hypothetical protein LLH06_04880 [Mucilaginibacter daejeonensis]|uniref:hypothetical protein n=1 Tax=Mucilaginibacter daejeonensis TaxID=398049 RepID=UPI001D17CABE|nr:hypothetical protein [Mucilaginibacter daejeonensis]UEG54300.1 hypothetical protein LLH06_04880 [Mucilaginibacter daejeonensis]